MPIIHIEMLKGRSKDAKKKIARELIDAFIRADGKGTPDAFNVVFAEVEKSDWAVGYDMMDVKYPDK